MWLFYFKYCVKKKRNKKENDGDRLKPFISTGLTSQAPFLDQKDMLKWLNVIDTKTHLKVIIHVLIFDATTGDDKQQKQVQRLIQTKRRSSANRITAQVSILNVTGKDQGIMSVNKDPWTITHIKPNIWLVTILLYLLTIRSNWKCTDSDWKQNYSCTFPVQVWKGRKPETPLQQNLNRRVIPQWLILTVTL